MPRFFVSKGNDWCHLCGRRSHTRFVGFDVPENAEHSRKDSRRGYVRLCYECVRAALAAVETEDGQVLMGKE